jgi:hypothetical protein
MAESYFESKNPKFINFSIVPKGVQLEFEGLVHHSLDVWNLLMKRTDARLGYGVGYSGTDVAGNISYKGPDVPFSTKLKNIPWGRAVLCKAEFREATEATEPSIDPDTQEEIPGEPAQPAKIILQMVSDKSGNTNFVHGVCYGTCIKDNTVQLECGISLGDTENINVPPDGNGRTTLVLAVMANTTIYEGALSNQGETVVVISEAIDPSVLRANNGIGFYIPDDPILRRGMVFTVRGNLLASPCNRPAPTHTSFWNAFANIPAETLIDGSLSEIPLYSDN